MGRQQTITVDQSIEELKRLKLGQKNINMQKRVNALIEIKKNPMRTRQELAQYLGIGKRTLERWLTIYKTEGISGLVSVKPRRQGSKLITPEIHKALEERLTNRTNSFLGYWHAHQWVMEEFGIKISYFYFRRYLIKHFGTKVKSTRKSHINKDDKAVAFFKNAT